MEKKASRLRRRRNEYVRKQFRNKHAEAIRNRGVQLPDLFERLPAGTAYREFTHELEAIRARAY